MHGRPIQSGNFVALQSVSKRMSRSALLVNRVFFCVLLQGSLYHFLYRVLFPIETAAIIETYYVHDGRILLMTMFIQSVFRHVIIKAKRIFMIGFGHQVYVHAYQLGSQQMCLEARPGYILSSEVTAGGA